MPDTDNTPEVFAPLPPETPLLAVLAYMNRQCRAKTGKPAAFFAIPRKLALPLAGERAEAKLTIVEDDFARACLDGRIPALLMAVPVEKIEADVAMVDGVKVDNPGGWCGRDKLGRPIQHVRMMVDGPAIPVIAIDMPSPLAAAWTRPLPRFAAREGFEEHPVYAACPFSRLLWDKGEGARIPQLTRRILAFCHDHAQRQPAPVFQAVMGQHDRARPLVMAAQEAPEALPDDPALAWATIEEGLEAHAGLIQAELAKKGVYGMEFDGELSPEIVGKFQAAFVERFKALAEYGPHPYKPGYFVLAATPMGLETGV